MYDKVMPPLTKQEAECYEMFLLFERGAFEVMFKTNLKQWEYLLYDGKRPELYPQDKKALFTLLKFKNDRVKRDKSKEETKQRMNEKMKSMGLRR